MDRVVYLRFKQRVFEGLMALTPEERAAWIADYRASKEVKEPVEVRPEDLDDWEF